MTKLSVWLVEGSNPAGVIVDTLVVQARGRRGVRLVMRKRQHRDLDYVVCPIKERSGVVLRAEG